MTLLDIMLLPLILALCTLVVLVLARKLFPPEE